MGAEEWGRMQQQTTSQQHPTRHTYLFGWPIERSKLVVRSPSTTSRAFHYFSLLVAVPLIKPGSLAF